MEPGRPPDNPRRRRLLVAATTTAGGVGIAASAVPFVASMLPSERAKAVGASVEAALAGIASGTLTTIEWRGKPVWILARTSEMLAQLRHAEDHLLDPDSERPQQPDYCRNPHRSIRPEYFIATGICTHLGCVPTFLPQPGPAAAGPDWPGGFFCPCHGSKFDLAGRVFRAVPAPSNLVVPPHQYLSESRVLIGDDRKGTS
jgi:ubiquinol-cytochrome c reductase iron-sulfur subunit